MNILETNGKFDTFDKVINRCDPLLPIYNGSTNNHPDTSLNSFEQYDESQKSNLFHSAFNSSIQPYNNNQNIVNESFSKAFHCTPIKFPALVEIQLRNRRCLSNAVLHYRRHERHLNLVKHVKRSVKISNNNENILTIRGESLCPMESDSTHRSLSVTSTTPEATLTKLMKQVYKQRKNKIHKVCVLFGIIFSLLLLLFKTEKEQINY